MEILNQIIDAAKQSPAQIAVSEADDPRVLQAAVRAQEAGVASVTLVGNTNSIQATAQSLGLNIDSLTIEDVQHSDKRASLADALVQRRKHRGMTLEKAQEKLNDPLVFANMLVHHGDVQGVLSGAVYSTADVVRTALQLIGTAPGHDLVSSFFLMVLDKPHHPCQRAVIFSDCALVVDPDENQLATIATAAVQSARELLPEPARVAMLSFSTAQSANHPMVTKVLKATEKVRAALPDIAIDGDVQFDAAIIPDIAARKLKESKVAGQANVFIFPDLNAGNIGYKIAERLGGAIAIGPLLQGLAKPANDLSRGCSADDVFNVLAITSLQAQQQESP
ncbi:MAG TPA: phosphate acetyltransferase [Paenalcaligenes sp.]|nr:phosphate acetyltransferase [Paenalcaligenes sp.]